MMTLKYPVPCVCGNDSPDNTVFTLVNPGCLLGRRLICNV